MIDSYEKLIEKKINKLIEQYGNGVRPGWVSEEISWLRRQKDCYSSNMNQEEKETE